MVDSKTLDILLDESKSQKIQTLQTVTHLDTKASIIIAVTGIILGIIFSGSFFNMEFLLIFSFSNLMLFLGIVLLFASMIISLYSIKLTNFRFDPELRPLVEGYSKKQPGEVKEKLISHFVNSFEENLEKIGTKSYFINASYYLLVIGLVLLLISFYIR